MPSVTNLFLIMGVSVSPQCSPRLMDFLRKAMNEAWLDSTMEAGSPYRFFTSSFQVDMREP
jgi:hypothetical protein